MKPPTALDGDKYKVRKDPMKYQGQLTPPGWFRRVFWLGWRKWVVISLVLYMLSTGPAVWLDRNIFDFPLAVYTPINVVCVIPGFSKLMRAYVGLWGGAKNYNSYTPALLKSLHRLMGDYKKKDYGDLGGYPVGNDPTVINEGKICALYYETDNARYRATLIGVSEAQADWRAGPIGDKGDKPIEGCYQPSIIIEGEIEYLPVETFQMQPCRGYWLALMKFYNDKGDLIPYDKEYSKDHFAVVAFPAGVTDGTFMFIMNETGTVYEKRTYRSKPEDIEIYPNDPLGAGWEICK